MLFYQRVIFFCLLSEGIFGSLNSLYCTLDPMSVPQHFAFYELYPNTPEGEKAIAHAWTLLSGKSLSEMPPIILPSIEIQPILSLVNRNSGENAPLLNNCQIKAIKALAQDLGNRKLKGFDFWNQDAILQLPPEEVDLARGLLIAELGSDEESRNKIQSYEASLDLMALQIKARLRPEATSLEKIRAMNDYIFSELHFRFPPHSVHAKNIDVYTFLPSVLDSRRGVCLGVSILYLSLAQRLELSLQAITPPGHIYLRYVDPSNHITNIETTARGINTPTESYLGVETKKLEERSILECIGLAFMNQAAASWHHDDLDTAVTLYEKASLFLKKDDYLLNLFLALNYLFIGKESEGKEILKKIQGQAPDHLFSSNTIVKDYLDGLVDANGIKTIFKEVDEKRSSILQKQKQLCVVLEKYPQFRQGIFHLAITWMQLGREKEALPFLENYAKMTPKDPTARYYIAAINFQREDFNRSWQYLRDTEQIVLERGHYPKVLLELKRALKRQCPQKEAL